MLLWRRQLERQNWQLVKTGKTIQLCTCITLFCKHFTARIRRELPNYTLCRQRETYEGEFLFLFSNMDIFVQNSTKGQSKRVWIIA